MNSLIIGNTSQLAYYFPKEYERIPSRDFFEKGFLLLHDKFYDRVYITFAEQRTFLENTTSDVFFDINVDYTIKVIKYFEFKCNKIIVYGSSEIWNNCEGGVTINTPYNFDKTQYINSKFVMASTIHQYQSIGEMQNVIIVHPFNFNSIYRKSNFLFSKVFDSIINKKKIEIGDTYFYRDIIHPKYVVERSLLADKDEIVGSGRLTFINDFIKDLYFFSGLKYEDYVTENIDCNLTTKRKINYLKSTSQLYNDLLSDTLNDLKTFK
jgi:nucleoside-diphosphate-sugar epimerase